MWFVVFAIATQLLKHNFNAWKCADEVAHTPSACTMKKIGLECPTWFDSECSHGMKHVTSIFKVTWTKMCWYHCIIAIGMCLTAKSEHHMEVLGWYSMQLLILHVHAMPCDLKHVLWICLMHLQLYNLTFYMLRGHTSCAYTWRCGMHVTWSALWLKLHQLVFHAFKLTDHSDMSQSTQLDPDEDDDDWQCASLPNEGPLEKRPRLQPENSVVKWLELPHSLEYIPFVYNKTTRLVHCGRDKMKCKKNHDGKTIVKCMSGCNTGDRQCMDECSCTCHILENFYKVDWCTFLSIEKLSCLCPGDLSSWAW